MEREGERGEEEKTREDKKILPCTGSLPKCLLQQGLGQSWEPIPVFSVGTSQGLHQREAGGRKQSQLLNLCSNMGHACLNHQARHLLLHLPKF